MKVILLQDSKKLGKKGDIVNVADGFAFNNLIPQGVAKTATEGAVLELEKKAEEQTKKDAAKLEEIKKDAAKIDKKKITITSKAKDDKLFGSVAQKEIAEIVAREHGITIDEKNILLDAPIKELTTKEVKIDYGNGIKAGIIVTVAAE